MLTKLGRTRAIWLGHNFVFFLTDTDFLYPSAYALNG